MFFSNINADAHVSTTINIFTFYKGGLGDNGPQKPKIFFKKNKQNGGLSFKVGFFVHLFFFWQGSLNPQNYELAPQLAPLKYLPVLPSFLK